MKWQTPHTAQEHVNLEKSETLFSEIRRQPSAGAQPWTTAWNPESYSLEHSAVLSSTGQYGLPVCSETLEQMGLTSGWKQRIWLSIMQPMLVQYKQKHQQMTEVTWCQTKNWTAMSRDTPRDIKRLKKFTQNKIGWWLGTMRTIFPPLFFAALPSL